GHPCPKPLGTMTWLVGRASLKGQTVLDCFGGSMTTAVACIQTGRRAICVELSPDYYQVGIARCQQAFADTATFFGKPVQGELQ
ncbi:MAG TPA: DNA methyltransferase, partial [Phycisphaerae bacterium]|nr:DNA methyltransferase [Phycisphaerae bacterium]